MAHAGPLARRAEKVHVQTLREVLALRSTQRSVATGWAERGVTPRTTMLCLRAMRVSPGAWFTLAPLLACSVTSTAPNAPSGLRPIRKSDVKELASTVEGKPGETMIGFVVCADAADVLLSGGCRVKASGPYEVLTDEPMNVWPSQEAAGWRCRVRIPEGTAKLSVTISAFCLAVPAPSAAP